MIKLISTYVVVDAISKFSAFLVLPLITSSLSLTEFGLYRFSIEIVTLIVTLSSLGLVSSCSRFNFETQYKNNVLFSSSIVVSLIVSFVLSFPIVCGLFYYGYSVLQSIYIVLISFVACVIAFPRVYFIGNKFSWYFSLYIFFQIVVFFVLIMFFEGVNKLSLDNVLLSILLSQTFGLLVALYFLYKKRVLSLNVIKFRWMKNDVEFFKYTKNLYFTSLISYFSANIDKFLVAMIFSKEDLGVYSMLTMFGIVIKAAGNSLNLAIYPEYFAIRKGGSDKSLVKIFNFFLLSSPFCLVFYYFVVSYYLNHHVGDEYKNVLGYFLPYAVSVLTGVVLQFYIHSLNYDKKASLIFKCETFFSILQVVFSCLLSSQFGLIGLIYVLIVINFLKFICVLFYVRKDVFFKKITFLSFLVLFLYVGVMFVF